MRTLLLTLVVAPAVALGQVPLRPPPAPRDPNQAQPQPPRAAPAPLGAPASPTTPGGPRPGTPTAPPGAAGQAAAARPPAKSGEGLRTTDSKCVPLEGRFMLSFNKADIVDLLEQASRWTCRNFVYTDDVARGKITLLSKTPVTADEAYAAFLVALNTNNIAIYPTGRYYKLIRTADSKKNPIPTYTGAGEAPATEQPITKVIRLQSADADQMRGIIGNFISPQGADVQSIPPDMLIVTDTGLNIRRIERILETVDRPGGGELVRIVQIRYAAAKDVADKLNQIFQAQAGAKAGRAIIGTAPAGPPRAFPGQPAAAPAAPGERAVVSASKILPDERTNKIIIIADDKSFQRILELIEQLDVPTSGEGGIHVVFLKNANAEELATTLSNLAQGTAASKRTGAPGGPGAAVPQIPGLTQQPQPQVPRPAAAGEPQAELLSGQVKITADKAQNALLIQASGADFNAISRLIDKLDRARRQVFVEAVIMEINLRNSTEFGVGMHAAVPQSYKGETGIIPISSEPGRVSSLDLSGAVSLGGFLTGFSGPVTAELKNLGLNIPSIGILIQALQSNADANILSTPHLVATDNEESEITVGQNVPFQAGYAPAGLSSLAGTNAGASTLGNVLGTQGISGLYAPIQRQPVELRLKIKPQINEGGNVRLQVDEQIEEITSTDPQLGPTTSKRTMKTQVVARDQGTIVIGGLIQERFVRSIKKVPLLGSLPILGWLFRDTSSIKQKTNLLLFLTPYIIRDEADYRRIYEKKRKEQQEFIEQFYGRQPAYEVPIDFTRKSGPYTKMHAAVLEETSRLENGGRGGPGERVITPGAGAPGAPAPEVAPTPLGTPEAPAPRTGTPAAPEEGPPVDRLNVQPEVPAPGSVPPPQAPAAPPAGEPPPAQPPQGAPPG